MNPVAIVYYTRTGNTHVVVQELARRVAADLFAIQDARSRRGVLGYLRSVFEALRHREVPIIAPDVALARYGTVVIATPVWASNISSPMGTWLRRFAPGVAGRGVHLYLRRLGS